MAPMPITDAIFLLSEARERPMHVGGLQLFEPPDDAGPLFVSELYRRAIERDEVRRILSRRAERSLGGLGYWRWRGEPNLDLDYHVRHSALPHPGRVRELLALVSRLHGTLLDRSRPLWEAHLIEGLVDGRFALYTKIHHALLDGVAAMRLLETSLSDDPDDRDMPPPWAPRPRPPGAGDGHDEHSLPARLLGAAVGAADGAATAGRALTGASRAAVRSITGAVRDEAIRLPYQAPRSILNVPISGARRFAADKWEFDRIRRVGKALDGTINDVVMAMCAGALRRYLEGLDALPDQPLVSMVPVSLRSGLDGEEGGNAVGIVLCNLATHLADPEARFRLVQDSMRAGKLSLEGLSAEATLLISALNFAPLGLGPLFRFEHLRQPPFNIVISNVPGPRQPLYYNGARMTGTYPVSIPYDGQALNITVSSYADTIGFGLTGCRRSVPSLQRMLDGLEESLVELEQLAGS